MRKEIMMIGLVGLLGCEHNYTASKITEKVEIAKPEGCVKVLDFRYGRGHYQFKCLDTNENTVLYDRDCFVDSWKQITIK